MEIRFILCAILKEDASTHNVFQHQYNFIDHQSAIILLAKYKIVCLFWKWTQFLSSLERFFRNAAKAVVDLDRARPYKCVLHSFFD